MKLWPFKPNYTKKLQKTQAKYYNKITKLNKYVSGKLSNKNKSKFNEYKKMETNLQTLKQKHQKILKQFMFLTGK